MQTLAWILLSVSLLVLSGLLLVAGFTLWVVRHYESVIKRIFLEKPMFFAPKGTPIPDVPTWTVRTKSGRQVAVSQLAPRASSKTGTIVFCHEFGADRWLADEYCGYLCDAGYEIVTFDFCNHGDSESVDNYEPLQWATTHEADDLSAVLDDVERRLVPGEKYGLFGVSRGGSAAIYLSKNRPRVAGIVTDGAFPTHGTLTYYEMVWIEIYSSLSTIYKTLPRWYYALIGELTIWPIQRSRKVRYLRIESGIRELKQRRRGKGPMLLMIHGGRDNYIRREIVDRFIAPAKGALELWVVDKAKHNACLERAGDQYRDRVRKFFDSRLAEDRDLRKSSAA